MIPIRSDNKTKALAQESSNLLSKHKISLEGRSPHCSDLAYNLVVSLQKSTTCLTQKLYQAIPWAQQISNPQNISQSTENTKDTDQRKYNLGKTLLKTIVLGG